MCELQLILCHLTAANHGYDLVDLFTSIFTPAFLKKCMPLVQKMICFPEDLETPPITGFAKFAALKELHLETCSLDASRLGLDSLDIKKSFFASSNWETQILANLRVYMEKAAAPLASIVREANGKFEVHEWIKLVIGEILTKAATHDSWCEWVDYARLVSNEGQSRSSVHANVSQGSRGRDVQHGDCQTQPEDQRRAYGRRVGSKVAEL